MRKRKHKPEFTVRIAEEYSETALGKVSMLEHTIHI